ncbi:NUC189-domain-containing protein [Marasmius fiardii PR-910]|nr:NUC189-domain-containing protein [Marasmius fiardii PR-910]
MPSTEKSKKNQSKSSRNRPPTTSTISQPSSSLSSLSSFSRRANFFAYLSVAVDKHRLSVFSTTTGKSLAEHAVQSARVSSLSWCTLDLVQKSQDSELPVKKKRRKGQVGEDAQKQLIEVVSLGLTNGSVVFFSPNHGEVMWTLVHPSSTASILSVVSGDEAGSIWTSGADGVVRLWNVHENDLLGSFKTDDRIPYSSMALRHSTDNGFPEMLVANHSIKLFPTDLKVSQKPKEVSSFPGHASSIRTLQWDKSQSPAKRFLSVAEGDRVISLWQVSENSIDGSTIASVQLDSDARAAAFLNSSTEKQTLLTLAASGRINVYPIPDELLPHKISSLVPQSTISPPVQDSSLDAPVVSAAFVEEMRSVRVARLIGGARPVFDTIRYQDENGNFIPEITLDSVKHAIVTETASGPLNRRYGESSNVTVVSGVQLGQNEEIDAFELEDRDNALDVDLAELSLGQRLTAMTGVDALQEDDSADEDDANQQSRKQKGKRIQKELSLVPAASLTRTLIQALHSSDSKLLETCLAHSDAALIRNTVRRLPPQLAVPLLAACVERLGRGARGGNMKGGGGGASSQRGTSLITWVKVVLSVHSGHMMTMPDLVARLSGLHSTLTSRLALQESLLSLSGRLDMVLSQIEMRRSAGPSAYAMRKQPNTQKEEKRRYVEGESEEEDARMDVEVEVESDEEGSIEDVELGGDSEESEESEDDDDEEEDEEDDDDNVEPTMNGFLDDEAEEEFTDEEDESE